MRKIQDQSNLYLKNTITNLGDSQSDLFTAFGVSSGKNWLAQLSSKLNLDGCLTKPRQFGISGNTTSQFLGRGDIAFMYDTPVIGLIYGGVNDAVVTETGTCPLLGTSNTIYLKSIANGGQSALNSWIGNIITITSGTGINQTNTIIGFTYDTAANRGIATVKDTWTTIPDATSVYSIAISTEQNITANLQALCKMYKYAVVGQDAGLGLGLSFYSQTQLPANGSDGQRYVIMNDTSTTGGAVNNILSQNTRVTGDYSSSPIQSVWEFRNSQAGELGWARVAINSTPAFTNGVSKVMIVTNNYLNWTSGGDNYNVDTNTGTQFNAYIRVRNACITAAANESVVLVDLYAFQSRLIKVLGETTQGSNSWHYATNNQHHNQYGHGTVARAVYDTIYSQSGWIDSLKK